MTTLRLAFGRINQETNALSTVRTELKDFQATHYIDDADELLRRCRPLVMEVDSMFRNAELSGFVQGARKHGRRRGVDVELVPCLSAWAVPSGPLTLACFDALVDRLCADLRAALDTGPLDGVYLSLHGAMNVDDLPLTATSTPESEIVRRVREVVGGSTPLAVSLDLHGLITRELVENVTFIQGYQTNPHRDHARVGARCAQVLIDTATGRIAPKMAWRTLPMLLGGGNTVDFLQPLKPLFQYMKALERDDAVLGVTLMTVHPWNKHPELGWATLVAVDEKQPRAQDIAEGGAETLAEMAWAVREQLPPTMKTPAEAMARARKRRLLRKTGVVVISDASDVVSAGAPGENTALVRAFIEAKDLKGMCALRDPVAVTQLWEQHQVGEDVVIEVGGRLDPSRGQPLTLQGRLIKKQRAHGLERTAVVQVENCAVVVVEGPAMAVKPSFYKDCGLRPFEADIVMVKNFFPFLLFFAPIMRDVVFVRTAGVTDFDAAFALGFADPMHPRDVVADWRQTDRRRRALPVVRPSSSPSSSSATLDGLQANAA